VECVNARPRVPIRHDAQLRCCPRLISEFNPNLAPYRFRIWLQNLPKDQVPACGPGLGYMLETMPMGDVLKQLMHGSGECAAKGWTFLTLGIPEWSLLCYLALGAWAVLISARKK